METDPINYDNKQQLLLLQLLLIVIVKYCTIQGATENVRLENGAQKCYWLIGPMRSSTLSGKK